MTQDRSWARVVPILEGTTVLNITAFRSDGLSFYVGVNCPASRDELAHHLRLLDSFRECDCEIEKPCPEHEDVKLWKSE